MWEHEPGLFPFLSFWIHQQTDIVGLLFKTAPTFIYFVCMHIHVHVCTCLCGGYSCVCVYALMCACVYTQVLGVCAYVFVGGWVWMFVCVCAQVCACVCALMHACVLVSVCMCVFVHGACVCAYVSACVCLCVCFCLCMSVYVCVCRPEIGIRFLPPSLNLSPSYWKILNYVYLFICAGEHECADRYEDHRECPGHSPSPALWPHSNTINPPSFSQWAQPWKPSLAFIFFSHQAPPIVFSPIYIQFSFFTISAWGTRYFCPFPRPCKAVLQSLAQIIPSNLPWPLQLDSTHFLRVHSEGAGVNRPWLYEVNTCWHVCGGLPAIPEGRDSVLYFLLGDRALFLAVTLSQVVRP